MISNKLHQAKRNKSLAEKLRKENVYLDWVITTSFYSSIHILEDFLLPIVINGSTCKDILQVKKAYKTQGRHPARAKLIERNAIDVAIQYKWLDDRSRYSRYKSFKIQPAVADKAIQYINEIFKHCS